jgi:hypothetical protein
LGLSIADEIATLFGGAFELVDGPNGRGVLARMTVPAAKVVKTAPTTRAGS